MNIRRYIEQLSEHFFLTTGVTLVIYKVFQKFALLTKEKMTMFETELSSKIFIMEISRNDNEASRSLLNIIAN